MADTHAGSRGQASGQGDQPFLPDVKYVIAISSGKGGVGKSTVAVNLAVALQMAGAKVGLIDADVYGPNVPMILGVVQPPQQQDKRILPAEAHGVKVISMAFFVPEETAVVWRGPMVHTAIQQFFRDVIWGELDYLLVDLPPGTGDAQLTLSQLVPLRGAITVTTPQDVALHDVRKGMMMFQKVNVPILGIIENMSYFVCGHCRHRTEIFSHGGGQRAAEKMGVPFLGEIPIDPAIRTGGDTGVPVAIADSGSPQAIAFRDIAATLDAALRAQDQAGQKKSSLESLIQKIKKPKGDAS